MQRNRTEGRAGLARRIFPCATLAAALLAALPAFGLEPASRGVPGEGAVHDDPEPQTGALFGGAVAAAADVDGDGVPDAIVGSPGRGGTETDFGRAYVFAGSGSVPIRTLNPPSPQPNGRFGAAVAGVADADGDAFGDLAVGAPGEVPGGAVHVFRGSNGAHLLTATSPEFGLDGGFGSALAELPDLDGDGRSDLLVGAPGEETTQNSGAAYAVSGRTGVSFLRLSSPTPELDPEFGFSVAAVPDADGDGRVDLLVGSRGTNAHLFSGATGALLVSVAPAGNPVEAGIVVSGMHDATGDGRGDLLFGLPGEGPNGRGAVFVHSGATGELHGPLLPPHTEGFLNFGRAVRGIPDFDGDGFGDALVSDVGELGGHSNLVRLYSGLQPRGTIRLLGTYADPDAETSGDFGAVLAGGRDLDGDAIPDILVADPLERSPTGVPEAGRVYRFSGISSNVSNISTRGRMGIGDRALIAGLIVGGNEPATILVSAIGPSLAAFGVPDTAADPGVALFRGTESIAVNDDWREAPNADAILASGLAPGDDAEAAILATLPPGQYTAIVTGPAESLGNGLVQIFDTGGSSVGLQNLSTRGFVGTEAEVLIAGIVVNGPALGTVVVRGLGPTLSGFGVPDALPDPTLVVVDASGRPVVANDDWADYPDAARIAELGLAPPDGREPAALVVLEPGNYTAILSGAGGATGNGLVEVYRLR